MNVSVVVVAHDMARELPRTLWSLRPERQLGLDPDGYEVIVVDNGSATPIERSHLGPFEGRLRIERLDPAPASPAQAANHGLSLAEGDLIGLIIDGARLASPGLVGGAARAARLAERLVITAPAFHLGAVPHKRAAEVGYDQAMEDALLAGSGWEDDGYQLFNVSTLAGSSGRGLFGAMGESSSLFAGRAIWDELGGLDERFALPGGGLVNHDLYRRACALPGIELVVLLGEGTFHQHHGGAATSGRFSWDDMHADYQAIREAEYRPPDTPPIYVGRLAPPVLAHVKRSAGQALKALRQ